MAIDLPDAVRSTRALAEAHRLDLALFVAFEEACLRVGESLVRHAPDAASLAFAAQHVADAARHHERFRQRLERTLAAASSDRAARAEAAVLQLLHAGRGAAPASCSVEAITSAVVTPPLRRFLDRCRSVADSGAFLDAVVLLDVALKGRTCPLCDFEVRYWDVVDPQMAQLIRGSAQDERRHVTLAADILRGHLERQPGDRSRLARLCAAEAGAELAEVFRYYIRKLVGLFAVAAQQQPGRFAGAEMAPGRPILETSEEEQVSISREAAETEYARIVTLTGLDTHGLQEPLSHA